MNIECSYTCTKPNVELGKEEDNQYIVIVQCVYIHDRYILKLSTSICIEVALDSAISHTHTYIHIFCKSILKSVRTVCTYEECKKCDRSKNIADKQ